MNAETVLPTASVDEGPCERFIIKEAVSKLLCFGDELRWRFTIFARDQKIGEFKLSK